MCTRIGCVSNWDTEYVPECPACMFQFGRVGKADHLEQIKPVLETRWSIFEAHITDTKAKLQATEAELQVKVALLTDTKAKLQATEAELQVKVAMLHKIQTCFQTIPE